MEGNLGALMDTESRRQSEVEHRSSACLMGRGDEESRTRPERAY